jgi:CheY-like chemotaxis protein
MAKKVLIIEDEEILSKLLKNKLIDQGYEAEIAVDGQQGIEKIKSWIPDLILLDIIMPKVNGFEVLESIKKDPIASKIPVIIVSNSGQPVELERAQKLGAIDWLVKTEFDPEEVIDKVIRQIGKV